MGAAVRVLREELAVVDVDAELGRRDHAVRMLSRAKPGRSRDHSAANADRRTRRLAGLPRERHEGHGAGLAGGRAREISPEPHRLECVKTFRGALWLDGAHVFFPCGLLPVGIGRLQNDRVIAMVSVVAVWSDAMFRAARPGRPRACAYGARAWQSR